MNNCACVKGNHGRLIGVINRDSEVFTPCISMPQFIPTRMLSACTQEAGLLGVGAALLIILTALLAIFNIIIHDVHDYREGAECVGIHIVTN